MIMLGTLTNSCVCNCSDNSSQQGSQTMHFQSADGGERRDEAKAPQDSVRRRNPLATLILERRAGTVARQ